MQHQYDWLANEKTRLVRRPNGVSRSQGETGRPKRPSKTSNFTFKVLAWDKLDSLRLRNANLLKSFRIYTFSCLSFDDLESAKSDKLHHFVLLHPNFDGINDRRDGPLRFSLASFASELFLDRLD